MSTGMNLFLYFHLFFTLKVCSQDNPTQSRCLGVFGLSLYTTELQITQIFSKYGAVERVQVVIDAKVIDRNFVGRLKLLSLTVLFISVDRSFKRILFCIFRRRHRGQGSQRTVHRNGNRREEDKSRLLDHAESSHPDARNIYGKTNFVCFYFPFFWIFIF